MAGPIATGWDRLCKKPVATGCPTKSEPMWTGCMRFGPVTLKLSCGPNRLRLRLQWIKVQKLDRTGPADTIQSYRLIKKPDWTGLQLKKTDW